MGKLVGRKMTPRTVIDVTDAAVESAEWRRENAGILLGIVECWLEHQVRNQTEHEQAAEALAAMLARIEYRMRST